MTEHYAYLLNKLSKDIDQFAPATSNSLSVDSSSTYLNITLIVLGLVGILYLVYKL